MCVCVLYLCLFLFYGSELSVFVMILGCLYKRGSVWMAACHADVDDDNKNESPEDKFFCLWCMVDVKFNFLMKNSKGICYVSLKVDW